jgi:lipid II:glycine glycyltransferase (peptidoglycan interpeptide bridge formation enzyme)
LEKIDIQINEIIKQQKLELTKTYNKLIKVNDALKSEDSKKRYRNKIKNNIKQIEDVEEYIIEK